MKISPWVGLFAAGPVSPALARLPGLHAQLGPVTAASLRVASRIANGLKAGHHATPQNMGAASLFLVSGRGAAFGLHAHKGGRFAELLGTQCFRTVFKSILGLVKNIKHC